ncbi:MAG: hypothetical protein FWD69_05025 [Polyangiaceae bacterium]|nr:hypothetical protein [Polyangiaceae bacterium]
MVEADQVLRPGRRGARFVALLALGVRLSRRGFVAVLALVLAFFTVASMSVFAFVLAARSRSAPVYDLPILASSALAWGGGFLLAFAVATRVLRKDRDSGVRDLLTARSASLRGYLVARIGGLAALLAIVAGGGTLVCGLFAILARGAVATRTMQTTLAAIAYAIAFAGVMAPVAFAALGARSRIGGYMFLVTVVLLPEVLVLAFASILSEDIAEVAAIPAALSTLRAALLPGHIDISRALRALVALATYGAFATALVRRDAILVTRPEIGE